MSVVEGGWLQRRETYQFPVLASFAWNVRMR